MKNTGLLIRTAIIIAITLLGIYLVFGPRRTPTGADFTWQGIKDNLATNIRLGLDLKGGSHLVMRVKTEEYLKRLTEDNAIAAQNAAKEAGFEVREAHAETSSGSYRVVLQAPDPSRIKDIRDAVEKKVDLGERAGWSFASSGNEVSWTLSGA